MGGRYAERAWGEHWPELAGAIKHQRWHHCVWKDHTRAWSSPTRSPPQQFADSGLTISPEKCELHKNSLTFFGLVFSANGVSPDPAKVKEIHGARPPIKVSWWSKKFLWYGHLCQIHSLFWWHQQTTKRAHQISLDEIKQANKLDKTLQKLVEPIRTNKWAEIKRWFWPYRGECEWVEAFQSSSW